VTLRLEQIAAGLWPEPGDAPADDPSRVVRAVRAACAAAGGAAAGDAVRSVYESLLSARPPALAFAGGGLDGGAGEEGVVGGRLRAALLHSLVALCDAVIKEDLEHAPRGQVGARGRAAVRCRRCRSLPPSKACNP
jgi:hypothetical protein